LNVNNNNNDDDDDDDDDNNNNNNNNTCIGCGNNAIKVVVTSKLLGLDINNNLTGKTLSPNLIQLQKYVLKRYNAPSYPGRMESLNTLLSNSQDLHSVACFAIMPVTPLMTTDILQVGRLCSSPKCPDQIWDPASNLLSEYQELFPRG
jgi:hypothetical protein